MGCCNNQPIGGSNITYNLSKQNNRTLLKFRETQNDIFPEEKNYFSLSHSSAFPDNQKFFSYYTNINNNINKTNNKTQKYFEIVPQKIKNTTEEQKNKKIVPRNKNGKSKEIKLDLSNLQENIDKSNDQLSDKFYGNKFKRDKISQSLEQNNFGVANSNDNCVLNTCRYKRRNLSLDKYKDVFGDGEIKEKNINDFFKKTFYKKRSKSVMIDEEKEKAYNNYYYYPNISNVNKRMLEEN